MRSSIPILERLKYKEAIKYSESLVGVLVNGVVPIEEIPSSISSFIKEVININSVPTAKIPNDTPVHELILWTINVFDENKGARLFFRPNEVYWKFWLDITIIDFRVFVSNILLTSKVKDFYLSDISGNVIKVLLDEEYSFDLFIKKH